MIRFVPVLGTLRPRLGQFDVLTDPLAKKIVAEAEPATRRVIRDERNRFAEALIGGIPFAALSALTYIGTSYLVPPESSKAKFAGYAISAAAMGAGAWWTVSKLTEEGGPTPASTGPAAPGLVKDVAVQAAQAIVQNAEPKIRQIVQEERARISEAAIIGLPFWAGSAVTMAGTAFMVKDEAKGMKTVGYSVAALLAALGAYAALEKVRVA